MWRLRFAMVLATVLLGGCGDDGPQLPGVDDPQVTPDPQVSATPTGCAPTILCTPDCPPDGMLGGTPCEAGFQDASGCRCTPLAAGCVDDIDCPGVERCDANAGSCACPAPALPCSPDCPDGDASCDRGSIRPSSCQCSAVTVRRITELVVEPALARLEVGAELQLSATALFDDGSRADLTNSVDWVAQPADAVVIEAGLARAIAPAEVAVEVRTGEVRGAGQLSVVPAEGGGDPGPAEGFEARGVWVTRWNFRNAADVERIMNQAADAGFNMVFFQVRGTGDAYYRSSHEPWAARLSGTLGQDPGWDPLQVAVDAAHARGLELHAWLNSMAAWSGEFPPPASSPEHLARAHPEWLQVDAGGRRQGTSGGYYFFSPGVPEVRTHLADVAQEITERYAVDGIHLDYIRYAGPQLSHDAVSRAAYQAALASRPGLDYGDWQREQVGLAVEGVYAAVTGVRRAVKITAAVWGVYRNVWGWSGVSKGYDDYFQDSLDWAARGILDALIPMTYWPPAANPGERLDYGTLVDFFVDGGAGRHVYPGVHDDFENLDTIDAMIRLTRAKGAQGGIHFAWSYLTEHNHLSGLAQGPYLSSAAPPPMSWKE